MSEYVMWSYLTAVGLILGSSEYTPSIVFPTKIAFAFISAALNAAAVSVVKYGLPVPLPNITTFPWSKYSTAFHLEYCSVTGSIFIAVCNIALIPFFSNLLCNANPFIVVANIPM